MKLTFPQKISVLLGAFKHKGAIKELLLRRYWQEKQEWPLDFEGVTARFDTRDFYSNQWFYGPSDIEESYEPAISKLIIKVARNSTGFMDIGANLGYFSVLCGCANPALKIVSVEGDETLAPIITRNLKRNGLDAATVISGYVGDDEGIVPYTPHPYSFIYMATGETERMPKLTLDAKILKIDDICAAHDLTPDLVKMDVDGAEMAALRAAEKMLSNPNLTLFIEVHPKALPEFGSSASEVGDFLKERGFNCYQINDFRHTSESKLTPLDDFSKLSAPTGDMLIVTRRSLSDLGI